MVEHLSTGSARLCEVTINAENTHRSIYQRTVHRTEKPASPAPSHLISKLELALHWKSEGVATHQGPLPRKKYLFKLLTAEALH